MDILDRPYELSPEHIAYYQKNRFIKLKHVFDAETIAHYNAVIGAKVDELNTQKKELKDRNTYEKAFLQLFCIYLPKHLLEFYLQLLKVF